MKKWGVNRKQVGRIKSSKYLKFKNEMAFEFESLMSLIRTNAIRQKKVKKGGKRINIQIKELTFCKKLTLTPKKNAYNIL